MAVALESAYPVQIDLDGQFGKMAVPPESNNGAFTIASVSRSHGFLDGALMRPFENYLDKRYYRTRELRGFGEIAPDNGGLQIMSPTP
jgi:hypothetical protein